MEQADHWPGSAAARRHHRLGRHIMGVLMRVVDRCVVLDHGE
jgi:hypothetical protein